MLHYRIVPVTHFQQNCTLFWCSQTQQAAIIDPGGDADKIIATVSGLELKVVAVLLTHGHLDHAGAAEKIARHYNVDIIGPSQEDKFLLDGMAVQASEFGFPQTAAFEPDQWLKEGDVITLGDETLEVYHCPGHTPGHVIFYSPSAKLAQVGDVLFRGSIGRTDFPGGNFDDLMTSIKTKLWPLGDDVAFIPGHGPMSNFGYERQTNPFVRDR